MTNQDKHEMNDDFTRATDRARDCMHANLKEGVSPVVVSDAFITQAMAVWAAETGRHDDAHAFIVAWTILRGAA